MNKIILLSLLFLVSCKSLKPFEIDYFESVYKPVQAAAVVASVERKVDLKRTSFSASGMSMQDFSVWFSNEFNKGIIYDQSFNKTLIYAEIRDATYVEVCNSISRHLNTEIVDLGNTIFIGKVKLDDMGVFIRKIKGVRVEDLKAMVASFGGGEGTALKGHVTSDGVVFLFDKAQSLLPFSKAFDTLSLIKQDAWIVQLYLIDFKDEDVKKMGIDLSLSGDLAYRMLQGPTGVIGDAFNANLLLKSLVDVSHSSDKVKIVGQPLFVMSDGSNFVFENKDSIPFISRIATDQGFIQDDKVQFIETGIFINVALRELNEGCLLSLNLENSKVLKMTEDNLPVRNIVKVNSEVPLSTTGIYLIAQSDYVDSVKKNKLFGFNESNKRSTLQVFARVFKLDRKFKGLASK